MTTGTPTRAVQRLHPWRLDPEQWFRIPGRSVKLGDRFTPRITISGQGMTHDQVSRSSTLLAILIIVASLAACSESSPAEPDNTETQTVTSTISPMSATVAQGSSTPITVAFTASGGLMLGSSFTINTPVAGIMVTEDSRQTVGSTTTLGFTVGADGSVPAGIHSVRFSTPVTGYTGTGSAPTANVTFSLTVTQ